MISKLADGFDEIRRNIDLRVLPNHVLEFINKYKRIEIVPVELKLHRGFFDYLFESSKVFYKGEADACHAFHEKHDCRCNLNGGGQQGLRLQGLRQGVPQAAHHAACGE